MEVDLKPPARVELAARLASVDGLTVTLSAPTAVDGTLTLQLDGSLVADLAGNVVSGTPTPTTGACAPRPTGCWR